MHVQKTITLKPKPNQTNWDGVNGNGGGGGDGGEGAYLCSSS